MNKTDEYDESLEELMEEEIDDSSDDIDIDTNEKSSYVFAGKEYGDLDSVTIDHIERQKMVTPSITPENLTKLLEELATNTKHFKKQIEKTNSLENVLIRMVEVFSGQHDLLVSSLKGIKENKLEIDSNYKYITKVPGKDEDDNEIFEDVEEIIKDSYPVFSKSQNGKILKGQDVELFTLSKHRNIKKVMLPNSGFYVVIKGPTLADLDGLYNQLLDDIAEYSYMFGTCSYLYHDLQIKQTFMEFIKSMIKRSNLKNWNKGSTLYRNIAFPDYNVLLHAICSLMYKSGYEHRYVCSNTDCRSIELATINVDKIKQYILSKIPNNCVKTLVSKDPKSQTSLEGYRNNLDLVTSYQPYKGYKIYLKVPTMLEYFNFGDTFNADMIENIHDVTDSNKINRYLRYSYFKIFTPWIDKIEVLHDDGAVNYIVNDTAGISFAVEQMQSDYSDNGSGFTDPIIDFIKASSLTIIAIPIQPCTKCNTLPENNIGGYVPVDIQEAFFSMLTMRLLLK